MINIGQFFEKRRTKFNQKGVTLVELMVVTAIFSLVLGSSISLLENGIKVQRQVLNIEHLSDDISYVTEYISRTIRMAKKDKLGDYITAGCNFETDDGTQLRFLNSAMQKNEFFLEDSRLKESKDFSSPTALTSSNFEITKLHFYLQGSCQDDDLQPRITVAMEIKTKEKNPQTLNVQTTISQRDLDVQY
jgi:prepilin-type N-terminal cleavage/methylation domain-containing protein